MKIIFLICGLLLTHLESAGQNNLTLFSFLSNADKEEFVSFQRQKLYYFNSLSYDLPFIEKLEFRTETNDFNLRNQEYLIRVTPNSFKNIKAQKQYQQSIQYMTEMELETALNTALKERYDLMVNFIYLKEILEVKNKQNKLLNDKVILLKRSVALINFDVIELIEATHEAHENLRDIKELENSIFTVERTIQRMQKSDKPISVKMELLPSIKDLKSIIAAIDPNIQMKHPSLEVHSAQLYNNMLEHEMESSKSKFSIGYVQAKYGYDSNESFREVFSLGIGFDVPLKRSSSTELNNLKIDILETQSQFKSLIFNLNKKAFALRQKLNNQIENYELIALQLEQGQAEFVLKEYQKIAETSPHALLKLRENTLKLELLLYESQYQIMLTYINYLDIIGLLSEKPLKNYLSNNLAVLSN